LAPTQAPLAVQGAVLVALHVNVTVLPTTIDDTSEDNVNDGVGRAFTTMVAVAGLLLPVEPEQTSVKDALPTPSGVVACGCTVSDPLTALSPDQLPPAIQDVAFVDDQVSVAGDPIVTDGLFATILIVGGGFADGELLLPHATSVDIAKIATVAWIFFALTKYIVRLLLKKNRQALVAV